MVLIINENILYIVNNLVTIKTCYNTNILVLNINNCLQHKTHLICISVIYQNYFSSLLKLCLSDYFCEVEAAVVVIA